MEILEDKLTVDIYMDLRKKVDWIELNRDQAEKALNNSLKTFTVMEDGKAIGMGRLVGDGAVVTYIQDLVVDPEYQSKRIGSKLIDCIINYVNQHLYEGSRMMLCLMCAKGREDFYRKHGFTERPTDDLGPGMIQYVSK